MLCPALAIPLPALLALAHEPAASADRTPRPAIAESAAFTVTNTGLATPPGGPLEEKSALGQSYVAIQVWEESQGETDLNGDGKLNIVLHVWDLAAGTVDNSGLALRATPAVDSGNVVSLVDEVVQDLNGDGDTNDAVLHLYDARGRSAANLGLAARYSTSRSGTVASFLDEVRAQEDLNGDGDRSDQVLDISLIGRRTGLRPPVPGIARQTPGKRLACASEAFSAHSALIKLDDTLGAVTVSESSEGRDLNGDGDLLDQVVFVIDPRNGSLTNLRIPGNFLSVAGRTLAFRTPESSVGLDLNGDGDQTDEVLHVYDAATRSLSNLGLAVTSLRAQPGAVAAVVDENQQGGTDLNGDGDTDDGVVFVQTPSTGVSNLGLATSRTVAGAGDYVLLQASEAAQGADLNGDGDLLDDVLHRHDLASGTTTNIGVALTTAFLPGERFVLMLVHEPSQGVDFNFDGDVADSVLGILDAATGSLVNSGVAATCGYRLRESGARLLFGASETEQGATDLNGDGDVADCVAFVYDANTGGVTNLGLAFYALLNPENEINGSHVLVQVAEWSQGGTDLNGDGDASDFVAHIVELK